MTSRSVDAAWFGDETATSTQVGAAVPVAAPDGANWDESCDVLVVGCGLAGCAATLRTAEDPALSVLAIDRGEGGGASALSGGVLYLGGTRVQQEAGIEDSAENMARYLAHETGDLVRPETVERFARQSGSMIPWLESHGARFGGPATTVKTSYPGRAYLYYSGNEQTEAALKLAAPAPRGHRAKPPGGNDDPWSYGGRQLLPPLLAAMRAKPNVRLSPQTTARRLFVDASGTVVGAEIWRLKPGSAAAFAHRKLLQMGRNMIATVLGLTAPAMKAAAAIERKQARPVRVRARRAVVLSAGGFVFNRTMLQRCAPDYVGVAPLGTIGDDGSGIKLGASAGGTTAQMDVCSAWRFLYPPASWTKAVVVGPSGTRIVNEQEYGSRTGEALFVRNGGRGWVIGDQPLHDLVEEDRKDPELQPYMKLQMRSQMRFNLESAPTLAELAGKIGVPADALVRTVETYNAAIRAGEPDAWGKSDGYRRLIETGPFYAYNISFDARLNPISGLTMGGLKVDEDTGGVLGEDGRQVPGLYAAGRNAVGICSNWYVSGLSLADCMFSGWRAADAIKHGAAQAEPALAAAGAA
jgi:3-oxo-5alpha-steroid 4-dehydrogenase